MKMFYYFDQNNSGGSFDFLTIDGNDNIQDICVEASSATEANEIAEMHGVYFDGYGDCPCCGNRWYMVDDDDATETPERYGDPIKQGQLSGRDSGITYIIYK